LSTTAELPEVGEFVIATVKEVTPHGAYVTLDEYGGRTALLHVSEVSTGWVRNISKYVTVGRKVVLKVIRVNRQRMEVDLSLRQVNEEERKAKLIEVKQAEKAKAIFDLVRERMNLSPEDNARNMQIIADEYGTLYEGLEALVAKGPKEFEKLNLDPNFITVLEALSKERIVPQRVSVRGTLEVRVPTPNGIDHIKEALTEVEKLAADGATVEVSYISAPRYLITVSGPAYKPAERLLSNALQKAKKSIESVGGTLTFTREGKKGTETAAR